MGYEGLMQVMQGSRDKHFKLECVLTGQVHSTPAIVKKLF